MNQLFSVTLTALAVALCCPAVEKKEAPTPSSGKPVLQGVAYALPKTGLRLEVQLERVEGKPGKYCAFAPLFFPNFDPKVACGSQSTFQTAVKGFSVTPFGVPDPNRIHVIPMNGSWRIARADAVALSEGGAATGFESSRQDKTLEVIFGFLGQAASVASKLIFPASATLDKTSKRGTPQEGDAAKKQAPPTECSTAPHVLKQWLEDETLCANYEAMSDAQKAELHKAVDPKAGQAHLAHASYVHISDLAKKLDKLLAGEGAAGAAVLVSEVKSQIDSELKSNFLGVKDTTIASPGYEWIIAEDKARDPQQQALAQPVRRTSTFAPLSIAKCGIAAEHQRPVSGSVAKLRCNPAIHDKAALLSFRVVEKDADNNVAAKVSEKFSQGPAGTFYYAIPSAAELVVQGTCVAATEPKECEFASVPVLVGQWGPEHALPEPGRDFAVVASLYSSTGALQSVKITSKALLDKDTIDTALKPVFTLLDAKQSADEKAETDADELTKLERRKKLAEAAKAIATACDTLTPTPSFCKE